MDSGAEQDGTVQCSAVDKDNRTVPIPGYAGMLPQKNVFQRLENILVKSACCDCCTGLRNNQGFYRKRKSAINPKNCNGFRVPTGSRCCRRLNIVQQPDLKLIQEYDSQDLTIRKKLVQLKGREIISILLELFANVVAEDRIKYIVTILDRAIEDDESAVKYTVELFNGTGSHPQSFIDSFLHKLEHSSPYIAHRASNILARLLQEGAVLEEENLAVYLSWLQHQVNSRDHCCSLYSLKALSTVLGISRYRTTVTRTRGFVDAMRAVLHPEGHFQILYQISFSATALNEIQVDQLSALVVSVCNLLQEAKKEKVVRSAVAFLRNTLDVSDRDRSSELAITMTTHKLLSLMESLHRSSTFDDEELTTDVTYLLEKLRACYERMSSFDEYIVELKSGELQWSPVHSSKRFWSENVLRFNDNKHLILKYLVAYLDKEDPTSLAVAVHDCGEYVCHYPFGKKVLEELSAKSKIMMLMEHEDSLVKYEALIAVQKMISDNWEFLGSQTKEAAKGRVQ
eukprot:gene2217-5228_t